MAPLKEVQTLVNLSVSATRDLVLSAAANIALQFPCEFGCNLDVDGCEAKVQQLQDFLRENLPPTLWEPLFQAVLKRSVDFRRLIGITDQRILFATFIFDNVNLKKLSLIYRWIRNLDDVSQQQPTTPAQLLINQRHVEFWLKYAPKLSKLVKVDLSYVSNDDVVLAFSRGCTDLKIMVSLVSILKPETLEAVFRTSKNLLNLDCVLDKNNIEKSMTSLNKLKLKALFLFRPTAEQFNHALHLCPDLVDLDLIIDTDYYEEAFQTLTYNPMKFSRLSLPYLDTHAHAFNNLCTTKGAYITELLLFWNTTDNPLLCMPVVSGTCKQLIKLQIWSQWSPASEAEASQRLRHIISFPKLQHMRVTKSMQSYLGVIALINLTRHCIEDSGDLNSLNIRFTTNSGENMTQVDDAVCSLLTGASIRMRQVKTLTLSTAVHETGMSERLVRTVCGTFSEMTQLRLGPVDEGAFAFLENLRDQARHNNLDLTLNYTRG